MDRHRLAFVALSFAAAVALSCAGGDPAREEKAPLIIVGIDGLDWAIVDRLAADGKLPHFRKLIDGGTTARLETIEPMLSPVIWTTIATGKTPAEHGITHFVQKDAKTGRSVPVSSLKRRVRALWGIASELGHRVGFVGWWASWPAEKVDGVIVSDHLTYHGFGLSERNLRTSEGDVYPPELADRIAPMLVEPADIPDKEILEYMHVTPEELDTRRENELRFSNPLHHFLFSLATNRSYENIASWILETERPELLGVYLEMTDSVSHLFMKYVPPAMAGLEPALVEKFEDVVYRTYERQDRILGKLMEKAGPGASFVILSDHGFRTGDRRLAESSHTDLDKAHLWHEKQGVLILSGPLFERGRKLAAASVYDIAPTVLYALGEKPARDMKGRVLLDAFRPDFAASHPVELVETYGTRAEAPADAGLAASGTGFEVDDAMLERLEALGYVDRLADRDGQMRSVTARVKAGDGKGALEAVRALGKRYPADPEILLLEGDVVAALGGSGEDVVPRYREAIDVACGGKSGGGSECSNVVLRVVAVLLGRGETGEAEKLVARLDARESRSHVVEYMRGLVLEKSGKRAEALTAYERALALDGSFVPALNNAAGCYAERGDTEKAQNHYLRAAALDPSHMESRYNLGLIALEAGRFQEAAGLFRAAVSMRPDFADAHFSLVKAEVGAGALQAAGADLVRYGEIEKRRVPILVLEAAIAEARGDAASAARLRAEAEALDPGLARTIGFRIVRGKPARR